MMPFVDREPGVQLHVYEDDYLWPWEDPIPVVLEHGFARHGLFWNPWVPPLCGSRRILRPDVRGFGASTVMPDEYVYSADALVDDIVAILDHFGFERVHWVGESSGGTLGLALAAGHPDRVVSLVLMDAPAHPYAEASTWSDNSLDAESPQKAIAKYGLKEWCRRTLGRRLDLDRASPELQEWYCDQTGRNAVRSAVGWSDVNTVLDLRPILPKVVAPTLILAGEKSPIIGPQQRSMAASLPNARLHLFEQYGHGLSLIATEECLAEVRAFWNEVEAGLDGSGDSTDAATDPVTAEAVSS
jgi:3-oxoadipate enol-lactonase